MTRKDILSGKKIEKDEISSNGRFDNFKKDIENNNSKQNNLNIVLKILSIIELIYVIIIYYFATSEKLMNTVRESTFVFMIVFCVPIIVLGWIIVVCIEKYNNNKGQKSYKDNYNYLKTEIEDKNTKIYANAGLYLTPKYIISETELYGILILKYEDIKSIQAKDKEFERLKLKSVIHTLSIIIKTKNKKYEIATMIYEQGKEEFELMYNDIIERLPKSTLEKARKYRYLLFW